MTNWYEFMFERPAPGRRAQTKVQRYLDDPDSQPEVRRASEASAYAERAAAPEPTRDDVARITAARSRSRRARGATQQQDYVIGPGGITGEAPEAPPPEAPVVPLSALTGRDQTPFGEDFVTWYETTRGRPLPLALRAAEAAPEDAPQRFEWGVDTASGIGAMRAPRPDATGGKPPGDAEDRGYDPARRAGITPMPDAASEWIAAEHRAFQRQQRGEPTIYDMVFLAIFGKPSRRIEVATENQQMRDQIRDGR